jgi:hypothetical protein
MVACHEIILPALYLLVKAGEIKIVFVPVLTLLNLQEYNLGIKDGG